MTEKKIVVNCETGEIQEIELTAEEIAHREEISQAFLADQAAKKAEEEKIAELKASAHAKLAALGLTEEEIAALS